MVTQEEIRQAQAAYLREWRKRNPEKNKLYVKRYWTKKLANAKAEAEQHTSQTAGTAPAEQETKNNVH